MSKKQASEKTNGEVTVHTERLGWNSCFLRNLRKFHHDRGGVLIRQLRRKKRGSSPEGIGIPAPDYER